jgi:hypothetical protein
VDDFVALIMVSNNACLTAKPITSGQIIAQPALTGLQHSYTRATYLH